MLKNRWGRYGHRLHNVRAFYEFAASSNLADHGGPRSCLLVSQQMLYARAVS